MCLTFVDIWTMMTDDPERTICNGFLPGFSVCTEGWIGGERKMKTEIIRSNRKSIELQLCSDGHIRVRAPFFMTDEQIADFLKKKSGWIEKHRSRMKERQQKSGQQGTEQRLSPQDFHALADEAVRIIPDKVRYYADKIGVDYGRITIRNQKTRWGSCSGKGNLNFNCLLMLAPEEVQDYVVIHELCHRREMNHSRKFWAEVERILPDYKDRRDWLKEHGEEIMRRAFL